MSLWCWGGPFITFDQVLCDTASFFSCRKFGWHFKEWLLYVCRRPFVHSFSPFFFADEVFVYLPFHLWGTSKSILLFREKIQFYNLPLLLLLSSLLWMNSVVVHCHTNQTINHLLNVFFFFEKYLCRQWYIAVELWILYDVLQWFFWRVFFMHACCIDMLKNFFEDVNLMYIFWGC